MTKLSTDNLCKQFLTRSGPTERSGSKFDSVPERTFEKANFVKESQQTTKKHGKLPSMQKELYFTT